MTAIAMPQRRKATTYGKASRKPIIATGAAFAQAAGTGVWGSQKKLGEWKDEGAPTRHYLDDTQASDTASESSGIPEPPNMIQTPYHDKHDTSKHKHHSSLAPSATSTDDGLFEVPSSDDDHNSRVSASDRVARKRRRITPKLGTDDLPAVFDDASLQRHVAAEAQRELSPIRRRESHSPSPECSLEASTHDNGRSKTRLNPLTKQNLAPKVAGTRKGNPAPKVDVPNINAKKQTTAHPNSSSEAEVVKTSKIPRKSQITQELFSRTGARPTAPENLPTATLVHRSGGTYRVSSPPMKELCHPRTPPRLTKTPDGATTPRQRELWNRLLSDESHTTSPSNLNLPALVLTEKKVSLSREPSTARNVTWNRAQDSSLNPRQKRIVDTLCPSGRSNAQAADDVTDDYSEDSSNDDGSGLPQSESLVNNNIITIQTSSSAGSPSRGQVRHFHKLSQSAQAMPSLPGGGPRVTYARQRSYLTDHELDEAAIFQLPAAPASSNIDRSSRKAVGDKFHSSRLTNNHEGEDAGAVQESQGGAMRSIHELREAGGNVRLISELEAILDDMNEHEPVPTTVLRTRLIDLAAKLQEPSNRRLFIDQGLESRFLAYVVLGDDPIVNSLLAAVILELISGSTSSSLLAQVSDVRILDFLIGLLGLDEDLVFTSRARSTNLSRVAQLEYRGLCTSLLKSTAWRACKPLLLSCHVLALQCLEYIVRQTREAGSPSEVLSPHAIRRVVATSVPSPSTAFASTTRVLTINLELTVSILESCTISNAAECQESLWSGDILERVTALLPLLVSWKQEGCATSQTLTLRLYLNLTNNNPGLCNDFSTPGVVEALFRIIILNFGKLSERAMKAEKVLLLDHLILALGSFINLAESSDMVRNVAMDLHHGGESYLDVLLALFMTRSKSAAEVYSEEEASSNVALGYLSVLISFLCLNDAVKIHVSARLRGGTLVQLVDAVEEFLDYNRQIDKDLCRREEGEDSRAGFEGRLQGLVDELRA